ncbi:carboxypeptidase inhibitor SmCI isoform X2 [Rhipicephalus microplus]|uniref:carboxypeptidase inhibitor SmCI isoform X2 n=1 Tax=Rhipicephalus microplus TaxID=6941 RepID=UPI003F6AD1C6
MYCLPRFTRKIGICTTFGSLLLGRMKISMHVPCFVLLGLNAVVSSSKNDQRCFTEQKSVNYFLCFRPTWQFDDKSRTCERTCDGKGPFTSPDECDGRCRSVAVCDAPRPLSSCLKVAAHAVFYYDPKTRKCLRGEQCTYLGNNFPTMAECQETCIKRRQFQLIRNRCRVHPDHGRYCLLPNRHGSARFYYDPYHGRCYGFWYYGCGGNRNNFATIQDCLQRCAPRGKGPTVDDTEVGTGVVFEG